jgi:DNA-binding response OmpR family regulator
MVQSTTKGLCTFITTAPSFQPKAGLPKILLVDDEPDVLESVKAGLKIHGFEVDAYEDPIEALKEFRRGAYEIALLDIRMPKMNGFELYREILRRDGNVKVKFFTAFEEYRSEFRKAFPELDERRFIKKPTTIKALTQVLTDETRVLPQPANPG